MNLKDRKTNLSHRTLDISNDGSVGIVDELDSDLDNVSGVTSAAEHFVDLGKLDRLILTERTIEGWKM